MQKLDRLHADLIVDVEEPEFAESAQQGHDKEKALIVLAVECSY